MQSHMHLNIQCRTIVGEWSFFFFLHSSSNVSKIDRPSSSRIRPTASNKRHRQRIKEVVEEEEEPEYDLEEGNEEEGAPVEQLDEK